jgi:hypothetical protein
VTRCNRLGLTIAGQEGKILRMLGKINHRKIHEELGIKDIGHKNNK